MCKNAQPCHYHAKNVPYPLDRGLLIDSVAVAQKVRKILRKKGTDYASKICACVLSKQTAKRIKMMCGHVVVRSRGESEGQFNAPSGLEHKSYCRMTFRNADPSSCLSAFALSPGVVEAFHNVPGHEGGADQVPQSTRAALSHEMLECKHLY